MCLGFRVSGFRNFALLGPCYKSHNLSFSIYKYVCIMRMCTFKVFNSRKLVGFGWFVVRLRSENVCRTKKKKKKRDGFCFVVFNVYFLISTSF